MSGDSFVALPSQTPQSVRCAERLSNGCIPLDLLKQHSAFFTDEILGTCHKRQTAQAPTPQAPIRNRQNEKSRKRQSS